MSTWSIIQAVWKFNWRKPWKLLGVILLSFVSQAGNTLVFPLVFSWGLSFLHHVTLANGAIYLTILAVFEIGGQYLFLLASNVLRQYIVQLKLEFSSVSLDQILSKSVATYRNTPALKSKSDHATQAFGDVTETLVWYVSEFAISIVFVVIALTVLARPFGIALAIWATVFFIALMYTGRFKGTSQRTFIKARDDYEEHLSDILAHIELVKESQEEAREIQKNKRLSRLYSTTRKALSTVNMNIGLVSRIGSTIIRLVIAGMLLYAVAGDALTIGLFYLVTTYLAEIISDLRGFSTQFLKFQDDVVDLAKFYRLMAMKQTVQVPKEPLPFPIHNPAVAFDSISFAYPAEEGAEQKMLLHGLSLALQPGHIYGIVGRTGSGKSTLARLLRRQYDVSQGKIVIGDADIRDIDPDELGRQVVYLEQNPTLLNGTILEALRYGTGQISMDRVVQAAKLAALHDDVMQMPEQYNTLIGVDGNKLSGGERQRLAFARTLLRNPSILILDECTSMVDALTEEQMSQNLVARRETVTIIIAHRLSTVRHADEILVLDQGHHIAERGNHESLIAQGGIYAAMYHTQTGN